MAPIPPPRTTIQGLIDAHHEAHAEAPRRHMGASELGHHCDRWLWLKFRWMVIEKHEGRLLRVFRRGHGEEATILKDLRAIGLVIRETTDGQTRVDFGSHIEGSIDCIIESGVPEAPTTPHIGEFKTHSKKSFDELEKKGVEAAKWSHFVQMQVYMHGTGIDRALYVAVCKDDDRMYVERVRYDVDVATKYIARGKRLALADEMPPPVTTDPTWYLCTWCPAHAVCHKGAGVIAPQTCRSCAHATAKEDSTWRCEKHNADNIPLAFQRTGCSDYELHDHLLPF